MEKVLLKIRRQKSPTSPSYLEEFEVKYTPRMSIFSALQIIQKYPVNVRGEETSPVIWSGTCQEELCGGCMMRINGKVCSACSAKVVDCKKTILLEPLQKFKTLRDLLVDKSSYIERLSEIQPWREIDGLQDIKQIPQISQIYWKENHPLSLCTLCGACIEGCPNTNSPSKFLGASHLNEAFLVGNSLSGKRNDPNRIERVVAMGGIAECSNIQNCQALCPMKIPLSLSMGQLSRKVTWQKVKQFLGW